MQPNEFLTLADKLAAMGDEASHRSAVSRAYYAAYHHCNRWHCQLPAPGSNAGQQGGVHQTLINQLSNPAPELSADEKRASRLLGTRLSIVKKARKKADYDLQDALLEQEVHDALSMCRALIA